MRNLLHSSGQRAIRLQACRKTLSNPSLSSMLFGVTRSTGRLEIGEEVREGEFGGLHYVEMRMRT